MFWIKKSNFKQKNGYLYLRETVYIRDGRTLKRTPRKLGDRTTTNQRGKYSKKKDIYCGKVVEITPQIILTFSEFILNKRKKEFLEYKVHASFDRLLDDFVSYVLKIHKIKKKDFYSKKKQAYQIANGFFCPQTLDYVRRFIVKGNADSHTEIERFANRCQDASIYDENVIMSLYSKLMPDRQGEIIDEVKELEKTKISSKQTSFEAYMREQHKN